MNKTKIHELYEKFGQSAWLDNINRSMIENGELESIVEKGLRGVTSNPTIFEKAVKESDDYIKQIQELSKKGKSTFEIYDDITIKDIQMAADILKPIYEKSGKKDGYISLEINPELAYKTEETVEEGERLYKKVNRPNVMFKVPATEEGYPAITELLSMGINVNVTLIFSLQQYEKTAAAYMEGIKEFIKLGGSAGNVHSVASVFVSRIDSMVDKIIVRKISIEKNRQTKHELVSLRGQIAIASAKVIYKKYTEIFSRENFNDLRKKKANIQRVLWGSTSTKDPSYFDVKYVNGLIARNTVNTMPEKTFYAFLDHGILKETIYEDMESAGQILDRVKKYGIDMKKIYENLLSEGVEKFADSFNSMLNTIGKVAEKETAQV